MSKTTEAAATAAANERSAMGWKCPYTGAVFSQEQLTGYGNPPRSPGCPVGYGPGLLMQPVRIAIDEAGAVREIAGPAIQ